MDMRLPRRSLLKVLGTSLAAATASRLSPRRAAATVRPDARITRDVCILGGGSAGTYAAVRLRDMGKSVVVVERKGRLGGHAETVRDPATGTPCDIGVIVFENTPLVSGYFERFGVPLIPYPLSANQPAYVDFRTGRTVGYTPPASADFQAALFTYLQILQQSFPYLDAGFQLPDPVPPDLLLPFGKFAEKYGLAALVPTVFQFGQGAGDLLEDPTLFVLKLFSLAVVGSLAGGGFLTAPGGSAELYDNAAQFLGGDVLFDSDAVRVGRRGPGPIEVDVETPDGPARIVCEKLVVAFPPTVDNLRPLDLDPLETQTFSRFRSNYYATALVKLSGLPAGQAITNVRADTLYNLPDLPALYQLDPSAAPGLWNVKFGSAFWLPDHVVRAKMVDAIARFAAAGTFPVKLEGFVAFSAHAPFQMMVSSKQIAAGFYRTLGSLQGRHGTFYTGAAFQTNDSSLIWSFTEALLPQIVA